MAKYVIDINESIPYGDSTLYKAKGIDVYFNKRQLDTLVPVDPSHKWRADEGDYYYSINSAGTPVMLCEGRTKVDSFLYKSGNYFKTQEEAEFHKEELLVYNELAMYALPHNKVNLNGTNYLNYYWRPCWDAEDKKIEYKVSGIYAFSGLYFQTKEKAEEAVAAVGEDRVLKYYLHINK